jgi:hypothetical protein
LTTKPRPSVSRVAKLRGWSAGTLILNEPSDCTGAKPMMARFSNSFAEKSFISPTAVGTEAMTAMLSMRSTPRTGTSWPSLVPRLNTSCARNTP